MISRKATICIDQAIMALDGPGTNLAFFDKAKLYEFFYAEE